MNIEEILARLAEVTKTRRDSEIARALNMSSQGISNARKRGTVPYEKICLFAEKEGVSADYLLFGRGSADADKNAQVAAEVDMELFEGIIVELQEHGDEITTDDPMDFARAAAEIYSQACVVTDIEQRRLVYQRGVRYLNIRLLKEDIDDLDNPANIVARDLKNSPEKLNDFKWQLEQMIASQVKAILKTQESGATKESEPDCDESKK